MIDFPFSSVYFTILLFIISIVFILYLLVYYFRHASFRCLILVSLLVALSISIKIYFNQSSFNGLEYEDAYIYAATARYYENNLDKAIEYRNFQTEMCTIGSLVDCEAESTYSGHLIGYPSIILLFSFCFPYAKDLSSIVSIVFSSFAAFFVFIYAFHLTKNTQASLTASVLLLFTPMALVFSRTSLSEIISSFYVLVLSLFFLKLQRKASFLTALGTLSISLMSILIKRENIISILLCLAFVVWSLFKQKKRTHALKMALTLSIPIIFYLLFLNIAETIHAEELDISGIAPFTLSYFYNLFPVLMKSLFTFSWFQFLPYFVILGALAILKFKKLENCYLLSVVIAYVLIYSSHYRSWSFILTGEVDKFEFLRYIYNILPLMCVLSSFGIAYLVNHINNKYHFNYFIYPIIFVIVVFGCLSAARVNETFVSFEKEIVDGALSVLSFDRIDENSILITDIPLIFQIHGPKDLYIYGLELLNEDKTQNYLKQDFEFKKIYLYISQHSFNYNIRYPAISNFLNNYKLNNVFPLKNFWQLSN